MFDAHGREWLGDRWGWTAKQKRKFLEEYGPDVCTDDLDWSCSITPAERKKAFGLYENVRFLVGRHGLERVGFLTLTFADNVTDFKEAQRRFNNLKSNVLKKLFLEWVIVVEPQRRGAVHYHLLVVCREDIRTGFDFGAIERGDYRSASPYLRELWGVLRAKMPRYHFGRSELLPIKSTEEGAARYVGKYIGKGSRFRGEQFRGARMVRYSQGWRVVGSRWSWCEHGRSWRAFVGQVAQILGAPDLSVMSERYGKHWAFKLLRILEQDQDVEPIIAAAILTQGRDR